MNETSRTSLFLTVALTASLLLGATATSVAQTSPTSEELQKKMDDLEKQIADIKAQLASTPAKPAEPAPVAPATPPAPSAPTGLAGLLGPTTLSGFVDVYYGYNSGQPFSRTTALRNFDINSGQFGLNMIELVADKATSTDSRVGYHVALGFGQAMNLINAGEAGSPLIPTTPVGPPAVSNFDQYLKEGYLEYLAPVGKGLTIDVGKFVTNAGAEVIETKDNWNYSRGLLFSWAIPYFHFGVRAKYTFNSKIALSGFLLNGWNDSVDNNSGKTTGFTLALTPTKKLSLYENYYVGPEIPSSVSGVNYNSNFRHLTDTVLVYNATSKLSLMANYDYGHDAIPAALSPTGVEFPVWWSGIAGYIKYTPNAKWAVATRGEYFIDHNGFATVTAQKLGEFTGTLERTLGGHLMSRLEYRYDKSDQNVFPYRAGQFGDMDHQHTVTLGLVYAFTTAAPAQ
jgi:Putative beta-barrel porin-2, OmpL-like. bbp2